MPEPDSPERLRQAAAEKEFRFDSAAQLLEFVEKAYSDGKFWGGIGNPESPIKYPDIRQAAIKGLSEEFKEEGFDEKILTELTEKALDSSRDLYNQAQTWSAEIPSEGMPHPIYHGTNTGEGHIEMVMANTLMTTLALKRAARSRLYSADPETLNEVEKVQKAFLDRNYGGKAGIDPITPANLKKLIAYAAFHESGEWWPRMVPVIHLEEYRASIIGKLAEFFGDDPNNNLETSPWNLKVREEKKDEKGLVSHYQLLGEYSFDQIKQTPPFRLFKDRPLAAGDFIGLGNRRFWIEIGFRMSLGEKFKEKDTSFNTPLNRTAADDEDQHRIALARITRVADLTQCYDRTYQTKVRVGEKETTLGASALYAEMLKYMPHGLPSYGWKEGILSASVSPFFVEKVVEDWNLPPTMVSLLDQFGVNISFPDQKDIYTNQHRKLRQMAGLPLK